jgi:hypothetical protein
MIVLKMDNTKDNLFYKINQGIRDAYYKLVREKAKENGELIFCENGKIIRVKAKELLDKIPDKN